MHKQPCGLTPPGSVGLGVKQGCIERKVAPIVIGGVAVGRYIPKHFEFHMCCIVINLKRVRYG